MKLLPNWRDILWRAWSIRLLLLAAALSAIEVVLPLIREFVPIANGWFALMSLAATFAAVAARLLAQRSLGANDN